MFWTFCRRKNPSQWKNIITHTHTHARARAHTHTHTHTTTTTTTNESGHPWRTPWIRVKGLDRRPFILILDSILVYATLHIRMNFSPYPNFCKTEKTKSQFTLPKALTILQRGFYSVYLTHQLHHK